MAGYRRGLELPGGVVVVAGAATVLGEAVAVALAGAGAQPVLVDGAGAELDRVAGLCADRAVAAPTFAADLADPDAVGRAAAWAVAGHGRIDGWVQCAADPTGGAAAAGLLDAPLPAVRRVLDVDLLGAVHGARAALPAMVAQGHGVLVVVASLHGQVARPFAAPTGMAGAAVRVMAAALRQELRRDGVRGVAVTTVLAPEPDPAAPAFLWTRPQRVASTVLAQLRRPRLEKVAAGPVTKAVVHGHALVPGITEWLVGRYAAAPRRPPV